MSPKVLTPAQIDEFIRDGFTMLRGAFPVEVAAEGRAFLWKELGLDPENASEWREPFIHIKKGFSEEPFRSAFTARLLGAYDDLLGEGRYHPPTGLGWWPVSFPGFEQPPWQPPEEGWHIDGIQFHHHVDSPTQGLLPLFLFSEIRPGDGGTVASLGSHVITARILQESEPEGLDVYELTKRVVEHRRERIVEINGDPGDVALLHPFMLHARSPNTGSRVRFICNPCVSFRENMRVKEGDLDSASPVERAVILALRRP